MESAIPPSYEEAISSDHWALIAGYIPSSDLCAASLVCKRWHEIFAPYLWGNPARHFGSENDRVYVALTRFKRTLPAARDKVRQLTHTLHLPPALSEIYDGPKAEWLRDVLEQLPNLQSLVVSELPFFDHSALFALRNYGSHRALPRTTDFPTFTLRLLIATKCANTTSAGLSQALLHWPHLVFLDLSETTAARDANALSSLHFMPGLQVLKLRRVGLRDEDVTVLADAIGLRVRSLDIRDNRITDVGLVSLLGKCFHPTLDIQSEQMRSSEARMADEDWPSGVPRVDPRVLMEFRGDDLDGRFVRRLTQNIAGRLPSEDLPRAGLTHLYIANNSLSMQALERLIQTQNLHVLDAGALEDTKPSGTTATGLLRPAISGAEIVTPALEACAGKNLTSLRLDHSVVTVPAASKDDSDRLAELGGHQITADDLRIELAETGNPRYELEDQQGVRVELDSALPIYELPTEASAPRYELEGSGMTGSKSTASEERKMTLQEPLTDDSVKRDAVFAPEVVNPEQDKADEHVILTATSPTSSARPSTTHDSGVISASIVNRSPFRASILSNLIIPQPTPSSEIVRLSARRHEIRHGIRDPARGLLPGLLPSLRSLILTDVPDRDNASNTIVASLRSFISDCALEAYLACSQAALEYPTTYVPGRPRYLAQNQRSRELFALRQIVLEMAPPTTLSLPVGQPRAVSGANDSSTSPGTLPSPSPFLGIGGQVSIGGSTFNQRNRSSTGDPDTERFWRTQEDDFTFFGEEECGLPAREPGMRIVPRSVLEMKLPMPAEEEYLDMRHGAMDVRRASTFSVPGAVEEVGKSVVAELAKWRTERRMLAERLGKEGGFVEGFWKGEVKIVRPGIGGGGKARFVDWYGNCFEKGVYR